MNDCPRHQDCGACAPQRTRRGLFGLLFEVLVLYVAAVFAGGTLIATGHPAAVEVGRILHIVTLHDRTIDWAEGAGYERLAGGLRLLGEGVDLS